jgi:hypothetical protein
MKSTPSFFLSGCYRAGLFAITILAWLQTGCVSDAELLSENTAIALRVADARARADLRCERTNASIVTEAEEPGPPLGELYSAYRVRVEGCGKQIVYRIECRDEKVCAIVSP